MNKKNILACLSLMVLIIAFANSASATYYYTDAYFQEHFGDVKPAPELKKDTMNYVDSDAYYDRYGLPPGAKPPSQEELPITPPAQQENQTRLPEVAVVPEGANQTNETGPPEVVVVPVAENTTPPSFVVTNESSGQLAVEDQSQIADNVSTVNESVENETNEAGSNLTVTPAAVSSEGTPLQIIVIGFLVVIIVVMLVILLSKEDSGGEKWEEGEFFKEAKGKKKDDKKGKKKDKKTSEGKTPVKKKEDKKDSKDKKDEAGKKEDKKGSKDKKENKEVKPFLLKIKDEVD